MKKFLFIAVVMMSAVVLVSCGKDNKDSKPKQEQIVGDEDTGAYDQDMGHPGSAHTVSGNQVGDITGTPWQYELWYSVGSNALSYWSNGTFEATWNKPQDCIARVGYRYDSDHAVNHLDKKFAADYNYVKRGNGGQFSYIGAYGWTVDPLVEWSIVDDSFNPEFNGPSWMQEFGDIELDGAKYTIYATWRTNVPSILGTRSFLQIMSVRSSKRTKGHMSLHAHFKKFAALFHGQKNSLIGNQDVSVAWGKLVEVSLFTEVGDGAIGSVTYNHVNITDNQQ